MFTFVGSSLFPSSPMHSQSVQKALRSSLLSKSSRPISWTDLAPSPPVPLYSPPFSTKTAPSSTNSPTPIGTVSKPTLELELASSETSSTSEPFEGCRSLSLSTPSWPSSLLFDRLGQPLPTFSPSIDLPEPTGGPSSGRRMFWEEEDVVVGSFRPRLGPC